MAYVENVDSTATASASSDVGKDCPICAEKYNNSTHKSVPCEYADCAFKACKLCVRTYLLNATNEPHCMHCKKNWTELFIVNQLNRSFITSEYKAHRKGLLLDREISKLPETMHVAEKQKRINAQAQIAAKISIKMKEAERDFNIIYHELEEANKELERIKNGKDMTCSERKKFIMPCPNNDCRGYLSSQYKCGLCNLFTCVACHEIIGVTKEDPHTCKEENVQSEELIKKETKPCPTCGTRISKISGCDQMWCPECHKAFSWRTGLVDNGIIHNPHFYQYQRDISDGQAIPRNPGDIVCGDICDWKALRYRILNYIDKKEHIPGSNIELNLLLTNIHQFVVHITRVDLANVRDKIRTLTDFEHLRCRYILQLIDKEEFAKNIYKNDALHKKFNEMLHVYEILSVVGIELFAKLLNDDLAQSSFKLSYNKMFVENVINKVGEYNKLREYCNEQFKTISLTYHHTVPFIDEMYMISTKKY
jgi:hypothetical protein